MRYGLFLVIPFLSQVLLSESFPTNEVHQTHHQTAFVSDLLSSEDLGAALRAGDDRGFTIDFGGQTFRVGNRLIRGRRLKGTITYSVRDGVSSHGVLLGARTVPIVMGRGFMDIDSIESVARKNKVFLASHGLLEMRIVLEYGRRRYPKSLGTYSSSMRYIRNGSQFVKCPQITDGPRVSRHRTSKGEDYVVTFQTSEPVLGEIRLDNGELFISRAGTVDHRVTLKGLTRGSTYEYRVFFYGEPVTPRFAFKTSPEPLSFRDPH